MDKDILFSQIELACSKGIVCAYDIVHIGLNIQSEENKKLTKEVNEIVNTIRSNQIKQKENYSNCKRIELYPNGFKQLSKSIK